MIDLVIPPRRRSIGPFDVSRVLPYSKKRSVGPFVFVDEMGPLEVLRPETLDVLSHPHIGLATVTYMFRGKLMHRDSLGSVQPIAPGEVNLMNAGRGIVHSERVSGTDVEIGSSMHGIQTWIAIPENEQEADPDFVHYGAETLPENEESGVRLRVIMGELHGLRSPVAAGLEPLYAEVSLAAGQSFSIPAAIEERGLCVLSGTVLIEGNAFEPGQSPIFVIGTEAVITAANDARFIVFGGPRLEKPRYMWWNFVSTSAELIEQARQDWKNGNFTPVPNEPGYIPLPEGEMPKMRPR